MTDGISMIVASYVQLGNINSLLEIRNHRQRLLQKMNIDPAYALARATCLSDMERIDEGLTQALGQTPLHGNVERMNEERLAGWAQFKDHPEIPVRLSIYRNGEPAGVIVADHFREDLKKLAFGSGNHGFSVVPDQSLFDGADVIELRAPNGAVLNEGTWKREPSSA